MLTYEVRQFIRSEISRITREKLRKQPRNLYPAGGKVNEGLDSGDARPWYQVVPHQPSDAHRILPSLDDYDQQAA